MEEDMAEQAVVDLLQAAGLRGISLVAGMQIVRKFGDSRYDKGWDDRNDKELSFD